MIRLLFLLITANVANAQETLTLPRAVELATQRYAAVRVSENQITAAAAGIQIARLSYLPRIDGLAQINRATANNVYGLLLPQSIIPSISGPPVRDPRGTSVWGTAVGLLVSWEPFDFGARKAQLMIAEAAQRRTEAALARTKFEVATLTADTYLTLLAAEQTALAARAAVERSQQVETVVAAVVNADLRPGADLSRSRAERAVAQAQLVQAEAAIASARITLSQFTGLPTDQIRVAPLTNAPTPWAEHIYIHPAIAEQNAALQEIQTRREALSTALYPKFNAQGAGYGRGTGGQYDGTLKGGAAGLAPTYGNWAVGLTMTVPLLEYKSVRERRALEDANARVESSRIEKLKADLTADRERALASVASARALAELIPTQRQAAFDAERQARARYQAGLAPVTDVAEAARLLTQAEIDQSLARLQVWRGLLSVAVAEGDLTPLLRAAEGKQP